MTDQPEPQPLTADQWRALDEAATPGPWEAYDANEGAPGPLWCVANDAFHNPPSDPDVPWTAIEVHVGSQADATLIAAMRNALPSFLALTERLAEAERERDEARILGGRYIAERAAAEAQVAELREGLKGIKREAAIGNGHGVPKMVDRLVAALCDTREPEA